jgi:hypothetical protein
MAGYTVNITEVQNVVTATSSVNNFTITSDNNPDITINENSFVITATSVLSTVTIYTDAVELLVDDFANYFKEDWVSGRTYRRGQLVNDRYSLFVCSTGTLTTVTSTINPSDYRDTLSWTRVVWNEAPRAHLTVTNYLNVGTNVDIGGNTDISGNTDIGGNLDVGGTTHLVGELTMDTALDHLTVTNHISAGSLSVGSIGGVGLTINSLATFNGTSTFNNQVFVNGTAEFDKFVRFNNSSTFAGTATFLADVNMANANLTVSNLTATNSLRASGVLYPITTGSFGQVIANMGDYTAQWRNLGDLVFWSLSDDLKTNGFNIVSGSSSTQLTIGNGPDAGVPQGYLKFDNNKIDIKTPGGITIESGSPVSGGDIDIGTSFGGLNLTAARAKTLDMYGGSVLITAENAVNFTADTIDFGNATVEFDSAFVFFRNGINVTGGNLRFTTSTQGIQFGDGTIQRSASTSTILTTATSSVLGSVKIGSGISITADGTISATGGGGGDGSIVAAGTGTVVYSSVSGSTTTYTVALTPASSGALGGVRVGSGLDIDGDGVLSTTATSTPASRSQLGAVIIGSGINVTTTGSISVPKASASVLGIIRVGTGLSIDGDGILSGSATLNTGTFSLSSDAKSNHFKITDDTTQNFIRLDGVDGNHDVSLVAGASTASIQISAARNVQITAGNTATISAGQINLSSTATTIIGSSINTSELRVQKIYNYAGTYAPFFPAGVQYPDQTVQITAYNPDGGPLPAV